MRKIIEFLVSILMDKERDGGKLNKQLSGLQQSEEDERDYNANLLGLFDKKPKNYSLPIDPYKYVKDQGSWNSCASHSIATCLEIAYDLSDTNKKGIELSERFHYNKVRHLNGYFPDNKGQTMRDSMKIAQQFGICPEKLCPYISSEMNDNLGMFTESFAKWWRIKHYYKLYFKSQIKDMLLQNRPVNIGLKINNSFRRNSGRIEVVKGERLFGGHGVLIFDYNDVSKEYSIINSWGKDWKDKGICKLPYNYIDDYMYDMFTFTIMN
jgi:C1A family cysteine protease